jgi:hypothetical protein
MAKQTVNIGTTANDNTGDSLRVAGDKINDNFDELYGYADNTTTTALSLSTLNSTYATAIVGFKVYALSETPDPKIYTKTSTGWIHQTVTISV